LLRNRVATVLGPIVKYKSGPKAGQLVAPDIESWFQQDKFQSNPHLVAQWADLHNAVAQAWVNADPTHGPYVDAWSKAHPELVAKWIKDNPSTPQPKAPDLAVLFFENFSAEHPGMFPSAVTQNGADGKPQTSIQPVKDGSDVQSLQRGSQTRVVTVSSLAHRLAGSIHFDDLQWKGKYKPAAAYAQSKLANLLFTFELRRRSDMQKWALMSNAAHPGASTTDLFANAPGSDTLIGKFNGRILVPLIGHSPAAGALPTLFAATSPDAKHSGYYGPNGIFELKGPVAPSVVSLKAKDVALARRLWAVSEGLTGLRW
jgi:NAD(P)-dependent dehydrogenase (short-subunit alcohol dehydrogenase family)